MALRMVENLKRNMKSKNRRVNVSNDESYIESLLQSTIEQYVEKYLTSDGSDTTDEKKLIIEIKPEYLDTLLYMVDNNSISDTLVFKQLNQTIFEVTTKNINLFG